MSLLLILLIVLLLIVAIGGGFAVSHLLFWVLIAVGILIAIAIFA